MDIAINDLPTPLWVLNQKFDVMTNNNLAQELAESPFIGLLDEDGKHLKQVLQTSDSETNCVYKWKLSTTEKWFSWRPHKVQDLIYLYAHDVTHIKMSETYYAQILDAIPDMVLVKKKNSKIHWGNKAFQEYYGMSNEELEELIAAPFTSPDYTHQYIMDDAWVWNHQEKLVVDCEPVVRWDGEERKFQTIKMPILNSQHETMYTVGISRDITQDIENRERSYASAKMASLGEMAGAIAHEINNPISVILGKARHLRKALDANMIDKALANTTSIESHSERIAKIVHNLLSFCRDEQSEYFQRSSLDSILDQALSLSNEKMKFHDITLQLDIQPDIQFECASISISQILLNLINNAIDSIVEAGVKNPWIKISANVNGQNLEVRVQDSGPGVPDEIAVKIMQPFFTTKAVGKGTGLGLSICQQFAKKHHGNLVFDRGTSNSCFLLTVPLSQPAN